MKGQDSIARIRVAHVITVFSLGGATENTLLSVQGLRSRGYDACIITGPHVPSEGSMFEEAAQAGVPVIVLESLRRDIHPFVDAFALIALFKLFRGGRYHIVHTHSSKAGFLGRLAAVMARVPIIVHTIHGLPFHEYQGRFLRSLYTWVERCGAMMSHSLIAVTHTIVEKSVAAGVADISKFAVVRSGFKEMPVADLRHAARTLRDELGVGTGTPLIGKIARFSPLKGHQYLLDAIPEVIRRVPEARFILVGGGECEDSIRESVRKRRLENHVMFSGVVDVNRIPTYLAAMDIVVHTSVLEGLARVLPQSLALGNPAVSFDIDGAREVINADTGRLVEPLDIAALANAITDLILNPSERRRCGENGRILVGKEWSVDAMVNGIDRVYQSLLQERGIAAPQPVLD